MSQMNNNIDPKNRRDKDGPTKETAHSRNQKVYNPCFLSSRSQFAIPKLSSMADESSSTTSRPNDDRSAIVFGGFTRCKQPSVRDDGATVSQIEWFSIDVPDADSHCQKQKLNPLSVMEIEKECYFAALDSSIYWFSSNTALADGDTLYWASFDHLARHELVIHAYNLITDEWFEGYLDTCNEIFGKNELLAEPWPHGLLQLGHSKFCLLLQSSFIPQRQRRREKCIEIPYLYCVTIVVSKISNMDPDKEGFKDLNISVVATHKYPMDRSIDILDAQLL